MGWDATLCIPTLDSVGTLGATLEAIGELDPEPEHVFVVDGGSTDGTRKLAEAYGIPVVDQGTARGLSGARNVALDRCETRYLAMIDSDVTPAPGWLGATVECLEEYGAAAVTAEVRHDASTTSQRWAARRMPLSPVDEPGETPLIPGANGCYRTDALRDVGGWDEAYPFANEDIRVSERLREAGYELRYTERTHVAHAALGGVDALYQLWRWHRPDGRPETATEVGLRTVENLAKGVTYSVESFSQGRFGHGVLDLAVGPLHTYWDIRR